MRLKSAADIRETGAVGVAPDRGCLIARYAARAAELTAPRVSAMPMPPPMQSVARPFLAPRRAISCSSVVSTRAPEAPIGWPMAIAPPLTFTIAGSQPMSLLTASACAAKASFASMRSRSATFQPAFSSALRDAGIGPEPISDGSTPAVAQEAMRASGVRPRFLASSALITTSAAAPSLRPEAFAAVTVPSLAKAGRSLRDALHGHAMLDIFVGVDDDVALLGRDRDRGRSRP